MSVDSRHVRVWQELEKSLHRSIPKDEPEAVQKFCVALAQFAGLVARAYKNDDTIQSLVGEQK